MTPLQTLRLHLNEYERFIQRATEMEADIREEESGVVISNAYWETAYEAVFGTSKDVHSALRALNTVWSTTIPTRRTKKTCAPLWTRCVKKWSSSNTFSATRRFSRKTKRRIKASEYPDTPMAAR